MESQNKISVIIPVYNVAPFLNQCIDSVRAQTYENLEIILSNDGSTDQSGIICDEYAKIDKRIKVIHEANAGLSIARNRGIDKSTGHYIIFLDSDDYWEEKTMLKDIMNCLNQSEADVLIFGYKKLFDKSGKIVPITRIGNRSKVFMRTKEKAFKYLTRTNIHTCGAHRRISKATLIKKKLYFEKGVTSEDIEWTARLMIAAKSIDYYPKNCYIYRQREGSITKTKTIKNIIQLQENIDLCVKHGESIQNTKFYKYYMGYVAYQYATSIVNASQLNKADIRLAYEKLIEQRTLLKYGIGKKLILIKIMNYFLGLKTLIKILKIYYSLRRNL